MNPQTKVTIEIISYTLVLLIVTGLIIYKAILNPFMFLQAVALLIIGLFVIWLLVEYVFADIIAHFLALLLAPYFVAAVIDAIPSQLTLNKHYPVRAHKKWWRYYS